MALGLLCLIIIPAIFLIIRRRRQKQVLARYQTLDSHSMKIKLTVTSLTFLPIVMTASSEDNDCIF